MRKNDITKTDFADLYILDAVTQYLETIGDNSAKKALELRYEIILKVGKSYQSLLRNAIISEAEHEYERSWPLLPNKINALEQIGFSKNDDSEGYRDDIDCKKEIDLFTDEEFITLFKNFDWDEDYGGEAWANISLLFKQLNDAIKIATKKNMKSVNKLMLVIDLIHQTQHNTATIFASFHNDQSSWIEDLLTEKASMYSFYLLKQYASNEVIKLLKNTPFDPAELPTDSEIIEEFGDIEIERFKRKRSSYIKNRFESRKEDLKKLYLSKIISKSDYTSKLRSLKDGEDFFNNECNSYTESILAYRKKNTIDRMIKYFIMKKDNFELEKCVSNIEIINNLDNPLMIKIEKYNRELIFNLINYMLKYYYSWSFNHIKEYIKDFISNNYKDVVKKMNTTQKTNIDKFLKSL